MLFDEFFYVDDRLDEWTPDGYFSEGKAFTLMKTALLHGIIKFSLTHYSDDMFMSLRDSYYYCCFRGQ